MKEKFDIVFLCHEKDIEILRKNLEFAKKNIVGYRKIFIVSKENYFPTDKQVGFISEADFPFGKKEIVGRVPPGREGWYLQQFLKLYCLEVAGRKILDNLLIIDADCAFIRKTTFFIGNKPLYNYEIGYHAPYYETLKKIFGFGNQLNGKSGVVHHMLFQRKYVREILSLVRKRDGKELWEVVLENADVNSISGFSEWELYFNYMLRFHKTKIKVRRIKFIDFPYNGRFWVWIFSHLSYSYIASHDYLHRQKFSAIRSILIEILKILRIKIFIKKTLIKWGMIEEK